MGKFKRMDQVRMIIKTYLSTRSIRATATRLRVSKNTVKHYVRAAQRYNEQLSTVLELEDSVFLKVFYPPENTTAQKKLEHFKDKVPYWVKELRRVGVTRHLLWEEYIAEYPDGYGYSQFCEHFKSEVGRRDLTIAMVHKAGQELQVDFAGSKLRWVDEKTGEVHHCEVLVAVLPLSQYTFAVALPSQKVADFVDGLNQCFHFLGRLPERLLSDNLKSFVIRSDKYEPTFNDLCIQLAAHYQIDLAATRVRKPKDKASVENMVSTVYRRIHAPLRNQVFHSIEELNTAIKTQLSIHNEKPYQQKEGSRKSVFEELEYPAMKALPSELFELKSTITPKVRKNYHVYVGQDETFYSVPYQYATRQSTVVYSSTTVEIFVDNQRVAIHQRAYYTGSQQYQTKKEHMPKSHQEWTKSRGYDAAHFLVQAEKIGPATHWAVQRILLSRIHEAQSYSSCLGVLSFVKKYGAERLELAALRCQATEKASYNMIKNILSRNLDSEPEQLSLFSPPKHENIRGPQAYQ